MKYDGSKGLLGLSTMYKIGSKPDLRVGKTDTGGGEQSYKVVDDYNGVGADEKPNLIFGKSESVIDEEGRNNFFLLHFLTVNILVDEKKISINLF